MSAPMIKRVLGWFDRDEWKTVYQELFSGNFEKENHALKRLAVWKCRMQQQFPTAIELTWHLLSAHHHDLTLSTEIHQHQSISLALAMAVIRFVNLLTERSQKGLYAMSVTNLALEMGLPSWIIDIRHDATHGQMPSLPLLRKACQYALMWLKREYWDEELKRHPDRVMFSKQPETEPWRFIENVLKDYMNCQFQVIDSGKQNPEEINSLLISLEATLGHKMELLEILTSVGYLIPSTDQLHFMGVNECDLQTRSMEMMLPDILVKMWRPVLHLIHRNYLTAPLLSSLIHSIPYKRSSQSQLALAWINKITSSLCVAGRKKWDRSNMLRYSQQGLPNGRNLLRLALQNPSCYTKKLIQSVLCVTSPPLCAEEETQLQELLKVYLTSDLEVSQDCFGEGIDVHVVSDFPQEDNEISCTTETTASDYIQQKGLINWDIYPLGQCPGQKVCCTSLELPSYLDDAYPRHQSSKQMSCTSEDLDVVTDSLNESAKSATNSSYNDDFIEAVNHHWSEQHMKGITQQVSLL